MHLFCKLLPVLACVLLSSAISSGADAKEESKREKKEKRKEQKNDKNAKAKQKEEAVEKGKPAEMISIPKGHDSKGLKIPYFDEKGRLQMTFNIGVATRLNDTDIQMADLQIETFDETGAPEMKIALPTSVLNMTTRVIAAQTHVTIQRGDFELTGESLEFNTQTRAGKLGGGVRMLIYNLSNETAANDKQSPRE